MQIHQREVGPAVCLDLTGRIVLGDGAELLKDRVNRLLARGCEHVLLNLREVTVMDTSGLATMVSLKIAVQRRGSGDIKLLHLPARIHDLLVVTRLITLFDVFESEEEAVASFAKDQMIG